MARVIRFESLHDLPFTPEEVWPTLNNTDWMNRAFGLPPIRYKFSPNPEGGSTVRASARLAGIEIAWQELPFEWLEPEFYRVRRLFENGPLREAVAGLELLRLPGGTRVKVTSDIFPRNALGRLLAQGILFPKTRRDMRRIARQIVEFLCGRKPVALPGLSVQPVTESALRAGLEKLRRAGLAGDSVDQLERMLREAPDVELTHIRPLAVAKRWNADPWEVLSLFLHATRSGLLDFRWEVLCPNCRSSREPIATSLGVIERKAHCDVCQIEFDAQFDRSVELKFAVNPAIRPRDERIFCLAGPGGKPHVLSQTWLEPGQERDWKLPLTARPFRLRSPQVQGSIVFDPLELGEERPHSIRADTSGFQIALKRVTSQATSARVHNPNPFPVDLALDEIGWGDDILTAARVTNWQKFRDLFSSEVIAPGEQITVGSQVILFTDLRGSTAMYQGIGDAPAYALVRDHFAVVTAAVSRHHGAVVKTIGDSVMACFSRIEEALEAVGDMNRELRLSRFNQSPAGSPILKASVNVGACLAVNANGRLDYFGSTVNLAARMISCCQGGDLAVSEEVFQRPETTDFLHKLSASAQLSEIRFRGFSEPHRVWRIPITGRTEPALS